MHASFLLSGSKSAILNQMRLCAVIASAFFSLRSSSDSTSLHEDKVIGEGWQFRLADDFFLPDQGSDLITRCRTYTDTPSLPSLPSACTPPHTRSHPLLLSRSFSSSSDATLEHQKRLSLPSSISPLFPSSRFSSLRLQSSMHSPTFPDPCFLELANLFVSTLDRREPSPTPLNVLAIRGDVVRGDIPCRNGGGGR